MTTMTKVNGNTKVNSNSNGIISIRFNAEEQRELERYTDFFGLNMTKAIKGALFQQIEDWEDYQDGVNAYRDIVDHKSEVLSSDDFWEQAGV